MKPTPHPNHQSNCSTSASRDSLGDKPLPGSDDDLPPCQVYNGKSRESSLGSAQGGGVSGSKTRSPSSSSRTPLQVSPQCQYGSSSSYLQGAGSPSCEQVYYPHNAMNHGLLPSVSSSSSSSSSLLNSTGLNPLSQMSHQMSGCQLPGGQSSACALAQGSTSSSSGYGLGVVGGPQSHTGLSSCTYMQSNQGYPSHLTNVMNLSSSSHFPNPMA